MLLSRIAPVPEPVTVMSFQRLVSRLVLAASSAFAPVVAIVFVAVFANSTRSALLIRTPIAVALPPLVTVTPVKRLTPRRAIHLDARLRAERARVGDVDVLHRDRRRRPRRR